MTDHRITAYNASTKKLGIPQGADGYSIDKPLAITAEVTTTSTIDGRDIAADGTKLDLITVVGAQDLDTRFTQVDNLQTKLDHVTVTQAVDLDAMEIKQALMTVTQAVDLDALEARVDALNAAVVLKGVWDATSGLFPTSTLAGESWICSVGGTVAGRAFVANDRIVAIVNTASNAVYTGNWHHLDYTDAVLSVAGRTGAVVLTESDITDLQSYLLATSIDTLGKLNTLVGESLLIAEAIDTFAELNAIVADETLLAASSIDTLAKINAIVAETLIDDTDNRLTDTRVPKWQINGGLTAYATGGQANATELVASKCNVCTTCATLYDSFKLPTAIAELVVMFTNRGATACHLYPNVSDAIEANGPNNPILVNSYGTITLLAIDDTNWIQI